MPSFPKAMSPELCNLAGNLGVSKNTFSLSGSIMPVGSSNSHREKRLT
eukprot:CAMPEP_0185816420 /NCGR_PEP_ID=MMETSP1322-20130828/17409_1 /TAXON_ID=265543 /ORGANISM="Minutocellus polymorphus, Strain RCC2270" /LENGTH=47 /DNA_ID= /DNA_START= /DNA_END= /DNA_ORIENTATION=